MRIVIDMQGAQTESRFRGIGRYTLSFAQAVVRNRGEHDVFLALSGLLPESIEPLRAAFDDLLPQENIRVWYAPGPVREGEPGNEWRREVAELSREAFLASLEPDVVHISSLFEGYLDDAVTSIGRFDRATPVSVSLYDLIPLLNPDHYLKPNLRYAQYYQRKIEYLKQSAVSLAISEFTRQEGLAHLDVPDRNIVNVSTAIEARFRPTPLEEDVAAQLRHKLGLNRRFILYTGGADERKNLPRLIQAFAALPALARSGYQLLLAGKMSQGDLIDLQHHAKSAGLKPDELCFSGYVSDDELVQLYNLCELFVFPSWHEGFGLPMLEAMACGAPVIGASTASLPEVVGLDEALFDPYDVAAIATKLAHALEDDAFRDRLRDHGLRQAKRFSWDESARRAIAAWESLKKAQPPHKPAPPPNGNGRKPRLAFVSPLPPERTGIADYSAELLPALAAYYDIEVVVAQDQVNDPWVNQHGTVRDVPWLRSHANEIDRVLYQVGNSYFHQHMLSLVREVPGTVVLHDFYMSGLMAWLELHAGADYAWTEALYASHGYGAVRARYRDIELAKRKYPVNLHVLQHAQGLIVHSEYSRNLANQWYGEGFADTWEAIPLLRSPARESDRAAARRQLGFEEFDFVICSFGFLDETKLNDRLVNAWFGSALAGDKRCHLIFVGENHGGDYGSSLIQLIRSSRHGERIRVTGFASPELFRQYLLVADVAVQLRTHSRGETSAAVLDCMNHALPLIVNANGSIAELDPEAVWMLPDEFDDAQLTDAIETLWRQPERRRALGERAREIILSRHAPAACAQRYAEAIERFHRRAETATPALIEAIASSNQFPSHADLLHLATTLSATLPLKGPAKRLFLDVTATCRNDLRTGIERVARALLVALLDAPPAGYRIEPVYLSDAGGRWHYRYARHYTLGLLGCPAEALADEVVEPGNGDVLLGLDLSGDMLIEAERGALFAGFRNAGVMVYSVVFDLLPVRMPDVFPPGADEGHSRWLRTISRFDGAVCISKAVADDLRMWQADADLDWKNRRPFQIGWFHLGADVAATVPSQGLPEKAEWTLRQISARPSFLMVGTIEPRKGYLQAIEGFTQLWEEGIEVNLVIVGKEGWKGLSNKMRRDIPQTIDRLRSHPEKNKHLFWLDSVSDEYLDKAYAASNCLVAASYGEGFGLPLIEASRHKLPIIARDIPVFREVAGSRAHYFTGATPSDLSEAIVSWLADSSGGEDTDAIPCQTWEESARGLARLIIEDAPTNYRKIYVDISVVYRNDFRTGIQRAVRALLLESTANPPKGYQVVPVYLEQVNGAWTYCRAEKSLETGWDNAAPAIGASSPKEIRPRFGDVLLGLDLAGGYVIAASGQGLYANLKRSGVKVFFVVYDLLPITAQQYFRPDDSEAHARWLGCISQSDGVMCISRSAAKDFICWHKSNLGDFPGLFGVSVFHLGADIERSSPTSGVPKGAETLLGAIKAKISFLLVGTIEPRKGHAQVLDAFEDLWGSGLDINLIIVGKQGWMVESFVDRIRSHPELGKRLFWLEDISDEYLDKVYGASACLIASSYGEGFGLPLIEASRHKLPIIARDIPVFHEVAGEYAYYFSANNGAELAAAVKDWIGLFKAKKAPLSAGLPFLTWKQSAERLLHLCISEQSRSLDSVKGESCGPSCLEEQGIS